MPKAKSRVEKLFMWELEPGMVTTLLRKGSAAYEGVRCEVLVIKHYGMGVRELDTGLLRLIRPSAGPFRVEKQLKSRT